MEKFILTNDHDNKDNHCSQGQSSCDGWSLFPILFFQDLNRLSG